MAIDNEEVPTEIKIKRPSYEDLRAGSMNPFFMIKKYRNRSAGYGFPPLGSITLMAEESKKDYYDHMKSNYDYVLSFLGNNDLSQYEDMQTCAAFQRYLLLIKAEISPYM